MADRIKKMGALALAELAGVLNKEGLTNSSKPLPPPSVWRSMALAARACKYEASPCAFSIWGLMPMSSAA